MPKAPTLFTCPKCRHRYLGHEPLPDCPRCGYDYREPEGFRWDMLLYLAVIIGLISFLLMTSYYKGSIGMRQDGVLQRGGTDSVPISGEGLGPDRRSGDSGEHRIQ